MAYFSHGQERDRLAILFFMQHVECELTREQLYRVMAENDWMNYFDYQTAMLQLEEDGYLNTFQRTFGKGYMLSPEGYEIVELFQKQLPHSFRKAMADYCDAHREQLRRETEFSVSQKRQKDGSSRVELKVLDGTCPVLEINFSVPTHELATQVVKQWPLCAEEVFRDILARLAQ